MGEIKFSSFIQMRGKKEKKNKVMSIKKGWAREEKRRRGRKKAKKREEDQKRLISLAETV